MSLSTQKPDAGTLDGPWHGPTETLHISPGISATRYPLIDILKALAVQFIVLHHFSVYGPVSDALHMAWPRMTGLLYEDGLIAVQVFLVVGGYLAARALSLPIAGWRLRESAVVKRYLRLIVPYLFALGIVVLCSAWVRPWLTPDLAAPLPSWQQWLAHVTLLQCILGMESLAAGAWYVAMDFQLFSVLTLLLWLSGGGQTKRAQTAVSLLCVASFLVFNRQAELDAWAVYFFGAYGLGALAWWARRQEQPSAPDASALYAQAMFGLVLVFGLLALALDFRIRVALALGVALALVRWGTASKLPARCRKPQAMVQAMSLHSYALFLVHFPVLLLVNAAFTRLGFRPETASQASALGWGIAGWAASLWAAKIFYCWTESPAAAWRSVLRLG